MNNTTYFAKKETMTRKWFVVDATGLSAGRLASEVAKILHGKHKPTFTPHVDCGDHVIIINAEKVRLTGTNKPEELIQWHSGFPGGLKSITRGKAMAKSPTRELRRIIRGMLPHNKLGDDMIRKVRIHTGPEHNHEAQKPEELKFEA